MPVRIGDSPRGKLHNNIRHMDNTALVAEVKVKDLIDEGN